LFDSQVVHRVIVKEGPQTPSIPIITVKEIRVDENAADYLVRRLCMTS